MLRIQLYVCIFAVQMIFEIPEYHKLIV